MKSLFIDTSSSYVTIGILSGNNILYNYQDKIVSDMASKIMPIISKGLDEIHLTLNDIDKIYVVNGPGSFTGIRVGVTVAKTIAWALKKNIVPISSLEFLATISTTKQYIIPMIDARRGNVYAGIYDSDLNCVYKDRLISINELMKDKNSDYDLVSHDDLSIENVVKPNLDIVKIILKHINDEGVNPHNLNPNYLKLTEAEENKIKND